LIAQAQDIKEQALCGEMDEAGLKKRFGEF
jgi:hypothetical protein